MSTIDTWSDRLDGAADSLRHDGYAVIRDVVSAEDIESARVVCDAHLLSDVTAENEIEATVLLQLPELASMIFDERIVDALTTLLGGTLAYYPNYVARLNRFTKWHVDNGFVPEFHPQADHLYDPEFRHLQCVLYFQDNQPGTGGGLDVRPRSHGWAAASGQPDDDEIAQQYPDVVSVDSRAGDLVVFDGRLMHRGTPTDGTLKRRKYGLFWSASRNDAVQVRRYADYLAARVSYLRAHDRPDEDFQYMLRRYEDVHAVRFPQSYLPETVQLVRARGIDLAEI
jgi:hypothetical protein